jgi:hypothetical protein
MNKKIKNLLKPAHGYQLGVFFDTQRRKWKTKKKILSYLEFRKLSQLINTKQNKITWSILMKYQDIYA